MFIKRKIYNELVANAALAAELEKETKRLAAQITSETKDCKMGPWCRDCEHLGTDYSKTTRDVWYGEYTLAYGARNYRSIWSGFLETLLRNASI